MKSIIVTKLSLYHETFDHKKWPKVRNLFKREILKIDKP